MREEAAVVHTVYSGFDIFPLWVMHWLFFFSVLAHVTDCRPTRNTYPQGKMTLKENVRKGGKTPARMLFY